MTEQRFQVLVESLPSLLRAPGARPWDAQKFLEWLCSTGMSHGELLAARFVLGVWNSQADWEHEAKLSEPHGGDLDEWPAALRAWSSRARVRSGAGGARRDDALQRLNRS